MRRAAWFFLLLSAAAACFAQIEKPVTWQFSVDNKNEMVFAASVAPGWHMYNLTMPDGGPNPTTFSFEKISGAKLAGGVTSNARLTTKYEKMFDMDLSYFEGSPKFIQKFKLTGAGNFEVSGYVSYSACNIKRCVSQTEEFSFTSEDLSGAAKKPVGQTASAAPETAPGDLWRPVVGELNAFGPEGEAKASWLGVFLLSFAGGLLALLMPCIWPIIPLTVSVFLKRSPNNFKKAAWEASLYGLSILVIYLLFGLLVTLIFGAGALNSLATNAAANLTFFALLVIFSLSFFGAFELTLPASWADKINAQSRSKAGVLGIFFMAFTLVIVSFSCTAPIIGTLLVHMTTTEDILSPAVGMFGFGLALALPFTLFALAPSLMKKLPKSGDWLNTLKVVLGFLELALALKFLSVADMAYHWHILSRELFLVLWILIFASLGVYLLRGFKSAYRIISAAAVFAFVSYMIPGLWGAPLKHISAFLPPISAQRFNLYGNALEPKFYDYDEGMRSARQNNKPAMIDFTGYGCVNCRKMEAAVLSDPRVKAIIDDDFVLISLYVDDRAKLPQIIEKEENGKKIKLRTVGDKWSFLQRYKFGADAQPYYILLDNDGVPVAPWYAYDENVDGFIKYLQDGLKTYNETKTRTKLPR